MPWLLRGQGTVAFRHSSCIARPYTLPYSVIRKVKGGYRLVSHTGKNLGTFKTKAAAEKRERQVQFFKHRDERKRK